MSTLKPRTWYWYDSRNSREYVPGVTVLHEFGEGVIHGNYVSCLLTDDKGEVVLLDPSNTVWHSYT